MRSFDLNRQPRGARERAAYRTETGASSLASTTVMDTANAGPLRLKTWVDFCAVRGRLGIGALLCAILALSANAQVGQTFDSSGNGLLNGNYFVRQVLTQPDANSNISSATSIIGIITFDGVGDYSFTGQMMTQGGSAQSYSTSGGYNVASNGLLQLQNPIDSTDTDFGAVGAIGSGNIIVASSTENVYDDILIAIPAGSSLSNGTINGTYRTGFLDVTSADITQMRDGYFNLISSGNGSFGTVSVTGAISSQNSANTTQSLAGVVYSISGSNGSGTITFPTASNAATALLSGQKTIYVSPDGNVLLGGSFNGFDIFVGIKATSGTVSNSAYNGTYFTAALENDASGDTGTANSIDSFYGSTNATGQGATLSHARLVFFDSGPEDYTSDGTYQIGGDGTWNQAGYQNLLGANGQAVVSVGTGPYYSLSFAVHAKQFSSSGVFINPLGIVNSGSFAPITNSAAPGELVTIFGTGLASTTTTAQTLPLSTNLGGVQLTINGTAAPLLYVSPTQINAVVPFELTADSTYYLTFQVTSNNAKSNQVMVYNNFTAPGVFTATPNGFGAGAMLHNATGQPVTQANPAVAGEYLQLFVTGLGTVTPAVSDGAAGPSNPLSNSDESADIGIDIQDTNGNIYSSQNVTFAGLAPGYAGLYQINFQMPTGVPSGQNWVNVGTDEAYTSMAKIFAK